MSYTSEYTTALHRIDTNNPGLRSMRYFLDTAAQWHSVFENIPPDTTRSGTPVPVVIVLGHGIPEQLIHACKTTPLYLQGGSHASCRWSDEVMPRDSDAASRSMLGYALRLAERPDIRPLFVVPVSDDNLRKIAYLLMREGRAVHVVDIPPAITSESTQSAWERSACDLVRAVERHVGKKATARGIREADLLVGMARAAMVEFEHVCSACEGVLDAEARQIVLNSYYQTPNHVQWTAMLKQLMSEVEARYRAMGRPSSNAPRILVVGSQIMFPQYKVLGLVSDASLRLEAAVDATCTSRFSSLTAQERRGGAQQLIRAIARKHYSLDSSGAHVVNRSIEQYVEFLLSTTKVDGVVFHILKGQIEHDFTYARMEPLLEHYDIPVFRLETDYQYQDIEQLRIRLEAFAEMLGQRTVITGQTRMRRSA